jgi:hypothetical protein
VDDRVISELRSLVKALKMSDPVTSADAFTSATTITLGWLQSDRKMKADVISILLNYQDK